MSLGLEATLESLLFLSPGPVAADALAEATGAELHEVVTGLERLREHYEFERRGPKRVPLQDRLGEKRAADLQWRCAALGDAAEAIRASEEAHMVPRTPEVSSVRVCAGFIA